MQGCLGSPGPAPLDGPTLSPRRRDLKSANLLLTEGLSVRVADFGLARLQGGALSTMTGGLGTYHWTAPEVWG
jgi:serine/threonine protein kinase